MENMSHDLPFFSLTLLHFGPTWEGMFWLPDLKKDIIRNQEYLKRLDIFRNGEYLKRATIQYFQKWRISFKQGSHIFRILKTRVA